MPFHLEDGRVLEQGDEVVLAMDVDRFPDCVVKGGETATVVFADEKVVEILLDAPYEALKEWDNKVIWDVDNYEGGLPELTRELSATLVQADRTPKPGA